MKKILKISKINLNKRIFTRKLLLKKEINKKYEQIPNENKINVNNSKI